MNVTNIVVDELPEYGCDDCQIRKPSISRSGYDIFMCSAVNEDVTEHTENATRPSWCPLVVEVPEVCEWKKEDKATNGNYDIYVSPHYPYIYVSSIDHNIPTFCRDCGKRIKYVEEE